MPPGDDSETSPDQGAMSLQSGQERPQKVSGGYGSQPANPIVIPFAKPSALKGRVTPILSLQRTNPISVQIQQDKVIACLTKVITRFRLILSFVFMLKS